MSLIQTENLTVAFGTETVLDGISLAVEEGDRIGIIGRNGCGKTTLVRALTLTGDEASQSGEVRIRTGISIGYLSQHDVVSGEKTVYEEMMTAAEPILALEKKVHAAADALAVAEPGSSEYEELCAEYDRVSSRFAEEGGYELESRITGILRGVGFSPDQFGQVTRSLSGGQQTRLALARILFLRPDVLILDEPTNHLDLKATQWLCAHLRTYKGTLLLITHDRYLLDGLCTRIAEILCTRLYVYRGNYSSYLTQRAERMLTLEREWENQQKYIARQEEIIKTYRSFNREKSVRAADSRAHMLEKLERVERPADDTAVARLEFKSTVTPNDVPLRIEDVCFAYEQGSPVLNGASLLLTKYDRAVILGDNGTGKTTLFKLIMGQLNGASGTITLGNKMKIGYLAQQRESERSDKSVLDELYDAYPRTDPSALRNVLAAFLFTGEDVFKPLHSLSGGERARLELARLSLADVNLLLLDEPTNHLDVQTREVLEEALLRFEGAILAVSHDIYFINKLAKHLFIFDENGRLNEFEGNYDAYAESLNISADSDTCTPVNRTAQAKARKAEAAKREEAKLRKSQLRQIELEIRETEDLITATETELCDCASDPVRTREVAKRYEELKLKLDSLYEQWYAFEE